MTYSYDDQLIDAVAVRRRRLAGALLLGPDRVRQAPVDRVRTLLGGGVLAAVLAAGCVAGSFVAQLMSDEQRMRPGPAAPTQAGR